MINKDIKNYNLYIRSMFDRLPFKQMFDFKEKENNAFTHTLYMLNRTQSMFKYEGLPETIPQRQLELYLQVNGFTCFAEYENELYIFFGGLGGKPDVYYMPTICTVANPALNFSANLEIGKDCVIVKNDAMYLGLMPLYNRYASLMSENELSIRTALINSRIIDLISAPDDRTKESAELFLKNVENGDLGIIAENSFLDGIKSQPYGSSSSAGVLTDLIEMEQYLKAGWYNDIGLNANYNMKRESLNSEESQLNHDALFPLIDNMLECRQHGIDEVNKKYGLHISVKLASAWEDNQIETELEQQAIVDNVDNIVDNSMIDNPEEPAEPETIIEEVAEEIIEEVKEQLEQEVLEDEAETE